MSRIPHSRWRAFAVLLLAGASLAACATAPTPKPSRTATSATPGHKVGKPYQIRGVWYVPKEDPDYDRTGVASWYGSAFHMKPTASGELFDMNAVTAAHTTLPLPSMVEVTNLENGRSLQVRVNDRGPFVADRLIDLSAEGARQLGFDRQGLARVRVRYLGPAPLGGETGRRYARVSPPLVLPTPAQAPEVTATAAPPPPPVFVPVEPPLVAAPPAVQASAFRVQAGAFGDRTNAQRAADRLSGAGVARIVPLERDGVTLYRVLLEGEGDTGAAERLREAVAAFGFSDARILRDF
jgi:rare lipoprotein A